MVGYTRFSKLFLSHLDAEFKKQSIPSLKSLIADQVGSYLFLWHTFHLLAGSFQANKFTEQFVIIVETDLRGHLIS